MLVAKRKSLFDDKADEIQQLTFVIKQDIGTLNKQIAQLQEVSSTPFSHMSYFVFVILLALCHVFALLTTYTAI